MLCRLPSFVETRKVSIVADALALAHKRIAVIRDLAERFGAKKVTLIRPDTDGPEGIWCVPLTDDDNRKMNDDNCSGVNFRCYLTNTPMPWGGRCWGAEVIGTTRGSARPVALPEDQAPLDDDTNLLRQGLEIKDQADNSG
jgi:hypothetical protein